MNEYVIIKGKKYRKGYTTGSCAAAASKAAVLMLLSGQRMDQVEIDTPAGVRLHLPVQDINFTMDSVACAIIKDGGDDPDATHGLKIYAEARFSETKGIEINTGQGIGIVTQPGLKVTIGKPAINPVPMKMILKEVGEVLPEDKGVVITLWVPGGEEVAKRTFNPKLGILGGISILGTSGIVEPMSEDAWKESLALELTMAAAKGIKQIVFIFGNYGKSFVEEKTDIERVRIIKISNFVGFMLDKAMENRIEKILLVGHMGKLVKVAAGIFNTHSRVADARMEILAAYASMEGADKESVVRIYNSNTTEEAIELIDNRELNGIYDRITANAAKRCEEYTFNKIKIGTLLFDGNERLLSMDKTANEIIREFDKSDDKE